MGRIAPGTYSASPPNESHPLARSFAAKELKSFTGKLFIPQSDGTWSVSYIVRGRLEYPLTDVPNNGSQNLAELVPTIPASKKARLARGDTSMRPVELPRDAATLERFTGILVAGDDPRGYPLDWDVDMKNGRIEGARYGPLLD